MGRQVCLTVPFTLSGVACKDWHIIAFDKLPVWFDS